MRRIFMIGLAGLLLVGCGEPGGDGCTSNGDCPTGQYCGAGGACTFDCTTDTDCAGGTRSSLGKCVNTPPDGGPPKPDQQVPCGPSTCMGCCTGSVCQAGMATSACGKGGAACKACTGSATCTNGSCTAAPCGPGTCSGCCAGNTCMQGTSDSACGKGGGACQLCSNLASCTNGTCAPISCGPSTCASGCCLGNTCMAGTDPSSCGKGGGACYSCNTGQICKAGQCGGFAVSTECPPTEVCAGGTPLSTGLCKNPLMLFYKVSILSATVNTLDYSTVATGEPWDVPGGMPDPYAVITINGTPKATTSVVQDSYTAGWPSTIAEGLLGATNATLKIDLWDEDLLASDWIGGVEYKTGVPLSVLRDEGLTWKATDPKYGL
ncbi:MAG: C2 domain-containing protein [bacterium]